MEPGTEADISKHLADKARKLAAMPERELELLKLIEVV